MRSIIVQELIRAAMVFILLILGSAWLHMILVFPVSSLIAASGGISAVMFAVLVVVRIRTGKEFMLRHLMRKATGIMLIIYGAGTLFVYVGILITHMHIPSDPVLNILFMIPAAFIVTGGVFCLIRKYWKLCFASALLAVLMMIFLMPGIFWSPGFSLSASAWWMWSLIITGALPIIFVCIRKREWSESQA